MKIGDIAIPRANVWLRRQYSDHRSDPLPCAVVVSVKPFVLGNLGHIRYFWEHRDPEEFDFIGPAEAQECGEMALTWWEEDQRADQAARAAQQRTTASEALQFFVVTPGCQNCQHGRQAYPHGAWRCEIDGCLYMPAYRCPAYLAEGPVAAPRLPHNAMSMRYGDYQYYAQPGVFCCPATGEMHDMREPLNVLLGVVMLKISLVYASDRSEHHCFCWQIYDRGGHFEVPKSQFWTPDFVIAKRAKIHPVSSQNHDH